MAPSGIKGLIKVISSFYFATLGVFPVKTVILANVRPFRDKLIYFGCLFNPFHARAIFKNEVKLPEKNISLKSRKIRKIDARRDAKKTETK